MFLIYNRLYWFLFRTHVKVFTPERADWSPAATPLVPPPTTKTSTFKIGEFSEQDEINKEQKNKAKVLIPFFIDSLD